MAAENGNGLSRYGALATIIGTAFLLLVALFTLWSTANTAAQTARDLKDQVASLQAQVETERLEIATLKDAQVEIDTQLRASIDNSNKSLAWQLRINSMLWTKAGLPHFPTDDAFYPNIANGQSR